MTARLFVALCAAFPLAALAFSSSSSGNQTTFGGFTASAQNVAPYTVSTASDGRVLVSSASRIPLAGGGSFPISVAGSVSRPSAAAAIGRFLLKGSGVIGVLGLGVAVYELAQELGFTVDNSGGSTVVSKPLVGSCTVAPCYEYRATSSGQWAAAPWVRTKEQAGINVVAYLNSLAPSGCTPGVFNNTRVTYTYSGISGNNVTGQKFIAGGGTTCPYVNGAPTAWSDAISTRTRTPDAPGSSEPSTIAELEAAIAANNGWPSDSALASAWRAAVLAGDTSLVESPVVVGPASVPGASSVTVDQSTGNTTTVTQTVNNNYAGPTVTTTVTTTTTVSNTATGDPVSQSNKTESPVVELPVSPDTETAPFVMPCGVPGTPPCAVAVDETGMAVPTDIKIDQADYALDEWDNFITNIGSILPEFPTIAWDFALPTACGVIPLPAFEPALSEIDVCQFQPMFHQLMTVVWSLGALFGAISLFMRSSLTT